MSEPVLTRIARGERRALAECLDRYGDLVWSLALRFLPNRADAEDAVQEIFIDLWSNAGRYDPGRASEATFIAMIARRRLIDRLRRTAREPVSEALETAEHVGDADPVADAETRAEADRARRLLRGLKPEQQKVIRLSVFHGYSHQGIADKLGLPLGTVKTHLRRGLLRLREAMQGATP